jgi:hypothetical protein
MLTPVIVAIYTLLLPIAPNDFWYNVRAGAHVVATGSIPTTALFTTSIPPGTSYFNQAWVSQLLLFKTLELGGLSGIVLLRSFCLTVTFVLMRPGDVRIASISAAKVQSAQQQWQGSSPGALSSLLRSRRQTWISAHKRSPHLYSRCSCFVFSSGRF